MKNEKCEEILNEYLMLDKGERVPFKLSIHLMFCKKCREQIKLLKLAEKKLASPLKITAPVTDDSIQKVLLKLNIEQKDRFYKPFPIAGWIISGLLILALLFTPYLTLNEMKNNYFSLYYAFIIATCVTIYCAAFVWSHMDLFVKKLMTVIKSIS